MPLAPFLTPAVRIPCIVLQKIKMVAPTRSTTLFVGAGRGIRTPVPLGKRFSRPPRYDRFDIPAYFIDFYAQISFVLMYNIIFFSVCQYFFENIYSLFFNLQK